MLVVGSISPASIPVLINNSFNVGIHQVTGKIDSIVRDDGSAGGLVEIINNSCGITLTSLRAYATKGPQFSIRVDGIEDPALDVDLGNGHVSAFWLTDGLYCHNPKVVLSEESICIQPTEVQNIFRINGVIGNYTVEILDSNEVVIQTLFGVNSIDIDLTSLAAGLHFVRINRAGNQPLSIQIDIKS